MREMLLRRLVFLIILTTAVNPTRADTVKLRGKPAFHNVQIRGLRDGKLIFRGVSRETLRKPVAQIEWLAITGCPRLNQAEQAAYRGAWVTACADYEYVLQATDVPWVRQWAQRRLVIGYDGLGQFDLAVEQYSALLADGAGHATVSPGRPSARGSVQNRRAIELLSEQQHSGSLAKPSRELLLQLLIFEDVTPDILVRRREPHPESQPKSPDEVPSLGILPPATAPAIPPAQPRVRTYLPADTFLLAAVDDALAEDNATRAGRLVNSSLPFVSPADEPRWRFRQARVWLENGRHAEAGAALLDVHDQLSPASRAWALYYVGLAHERMGRNDVALRYYQDLIADDGGSADVQRAARAGLDRLRAEH